MGRRRARTNHLARAALKGRTSCSASAGAVAFVITWGPIRTRTRAAARGCAPRRKARRPGVTTAPRPDVPITSPNAFGEGTDAAVFSFELAP